MPKQREVKSPMTVFYSYAPQDGKLREQLESHLSLLRQQGLISEWHNRKLIPGSNRNDTIDYYLNTSTIILLLISPDYLASDYCYSVEMERAMERHTIGDASVIPIILRPVDMHAAPFAKLEPLPRNGKPVTKWSNPDEAFLDIANGIRAVIEYHQASSGTQIHHPLLLQEILTAASSSQGETVTHVTQQHFTQVNPQQTEAGKYSVQNSGDVQAIIQGDHGNLTITFGDQSKEQNS